jgi:phosphate-selective porin OprO and OprP
MRARTSLLAALTLASIHAHAQPAPPEAPPTSAPVTEPEPKPWKRFEIASDDGAHRLELRMLVHADARFFVESEGRNQFALRRVRPSLDGVVFRYYEFKLQPDFAGSRLQILDAYGNLHFVDEVQLRVGKGKVPVGLERLQSPADITFAERAFPTLLVPNRDIGAQLHGVLFKGAVEWAGGLYNGVANGQSGDVDENKAKDVVGRIFVLPFQPLKIEPLAGLGFGVAGTYGGEAGPLPAYKTPGQETFFEFAETAVAEGKRTLFSTQGYYYYGPVGLFSEYVHVSERVTDNLGNDAKLNHEAWQIAGSVVIGGKPSYKGVKVNDPLDPERGKWGAVELAARYSSIKLDTDAYDFGFADPASSAYRAQAFAVGLTWHFATRLRALVNYERTTFEMRAPNQREAEGLLVGRLQIGF